VQKVSFDDFLFLPERDINNKRRHLPDEKMSSVESMSMLETEGKKSKGEVERSQSTLKN
jgi:hypothetical protein